MTLIRKIIFALVVAAMVIGFSLAASRVVSAPAVSSEIETILGQPANGLRLNSNELESLKRFYAARDFQPAWSGNRSAERNRMFAMASLKNADVNGLKPADYQMADLVSKSARLNEENFATFDVLLSGMLLTYMRDLRIGRIKPEERGESVSLPPREFDAAGMLAKILSGNEMESFSLAVEPSHSEYKSLTLALSRYRVIQRNGGWPELPGKATGALTASDPRLPSLSKRLAMEGYLPSKMAATAPLNELVNGLKRFQEASGLEQTGTLGKRTFAALNISVEQRISQIVANMERWRWMPAFEKSYVEVNAAGAMLTVVDAGSVVLSSRIIAGRPLTPTPIFVAEIIGVTVNPYWSIPDSIAANEILPREKQRPGYMASQHIGFNGPGGSLRQEPGPDNALGRIKLEMPNAFHSYLHDTPARNLFNSDDRHLSHGCMRVQNILSLASWVMKGDAAAAQDELNAIIASGENRKISLDRPVPVYVVYWTAIADQDGGVGFRPDVYGRDKYLLAALAGQRQAGKIAPNSNCQAGTAG